MLARRAVLLALSAAVALAPAADAKPKKPITKTFQVRGTVPYPAEQAMCAPAPHGKDRHVEPFRVPALGTLKVEVTGFRGDMDIVITDAKTGNVLAEGNNEAGTSSLNPSTGDTKETAKYFPKRATSVNINVCNFAASPDAEGTLTFTYGPRP